MPYSVTIVHLTIDEDDARMTVARVPQNTDVYLAIAKCGFCQRPEICRIWGFGEAAADDDEHRQEWKGIIEQGRVKPITAWRQL